MHSSSTLTNTDTRRR